MLKKAFMLMMSFLFLLLVLFFQFSEASSKVMYVIETNWVNVRSGSSMEYRIVTRVKSGDSVTILGEEGEWFFVSTSKKDEGWVLKSLLKDEKPLAEQLTALKNKTQKQSLLIANLTEENNSLKNYAEVSEKNQEELKRFKQENARLKNYQDLLWAAVGAGILFMGWIMGLITGSFYKKGKSQYRYSLD